MVDAHNPDRAAAVQASLEPDLNAPGVVEDLVREGRIPFIMKHIESFNWEGDYYRGDLRRVNIRKGVLCYVVPPGTTPADEIRHILGGAYEIIAPDGQSKGHASTHYLTMRQASRVQQRVEQAYQAQVSGASQSPQATSSL